MRLLFFAFIVLLGACTQKQSEKKVPIATVSNNTELNEWINAFTVKPFSDAHSGNSVSGRTYL